jgi:hypothetical protein
MRGAAVVPEVSFKSDGVFSFQSSVTPLVFRRGSDGRGRHYSARPANLQRSFALLFINRLVKRQNNELPAQACDEYRWPIFVIADLHRDGRASRQHGDFSLESACSLFNITKVTYDIAGRIENRSAIAFARQRLLPRSQQWIIRFHRLQKLPFVDTFRASFRR